MSRKQCLRVFDGFRPPFAFDSLYDFAGRCGFQPKDVADLFEVTPRTVRNWNSNGAPKFVYLLLYCAAGFFLDGAFAGFSVYDGELFTGTRITHNKGFTPSELQNYDLNMQFARDALARIRELENGDNTNVQKSPFVPRIVR